jgi:hypothetical protein
VSLEGAIDVIESPHYRFAVVVELAERWCRDTWIPPTRPLTVADLVHASIEEPIAVVWTHPGFGEGSVPGCVWYIDQADEEVANGFLWCPPSTLVSEHGSVYVVDLLDTGALTLYPPTVRFAECFDLPRSPRAAYQAMFA